MEMTRNPCRICLTESEFNVSLFGSYCRRTNMIDKILVCLKLVIEKTDVLDTICYKCAENIERYHNFIMFVKKSQTKMVELRNVEVKRVTSYVREERFDAADCTFSFLGLEDKKETKPSSPLFSYFSPPMKSDEHVWKTPMVEKERRDDKMKSRKRSRHNSRDIFESQSQDEPERTLDWKLTPDDNIMRRVRDKCFGRSDF